ncbi:hypothetical protein PHJA_001425200 [Phtheirospermum japonicum]|uniref:Uncharacterized protein n=1 Tax=Phtheirospermum japonicum TaxID=374723 RepID=A0A830C1C9_9LAMI|nr:hypothetical protein PHJA_001425200 [Phtheirospermum japonicum]
MLSKKTLVAILAWLLIVTYLATFSYASTVKPVERVVVSLLHVGLLEAADQLCQTVLLRPVQKKNNESY